MKDKLRAGNVQQLRRHNMSKPLFRKTTTEFTKSDVVDVLLISGLAIAAWELVRSIRKAKRALMVQELLDTDPFLNDTWQDSPMDEPIPFLPTELVDSLLPYELGLCNSAHKTTRDLCVKKEGHRGTHIASDIHDQEYSWQDEDQIDGGWMCGEQKPNEVMGFGYYTCTRNKYHADDHCNGYVSWLTLQGRITELTK